MRRLIRVCTACAALALASCSSSPTPTPTPDPFSTVAQQAEQAYQQGLDLYQQGDAVGALQAFQRAQLLSPGDDARIDEMVQRLKAQLTPTAAPAPATPVPQPTSISENPATPSTELGDAYFGQVLLTIVPGHETVPPAMAQFSDQDQIGLYIEKLNERLHLAFELRIFDATSGQLLVDASSTNMQTAASVSTRTPVGIATRGAASTSTPRSVRQNLVQFLKSFVWYHQGGDPPGQYHAELYAGDVLTHTLEYVVGRAPVAVPTDTPAPTRVSQPVPVAVAQPAPPTPQAQPVPQTSAPPPQSAAPARPAPVAPPQQSLPPEPVDVAQPEATPVSATRVIMSGGPAALDVLESSGELYVADRSALVWGVNHDQPTLKRPFTVSGQPIGLAADASTGRLYIAVRSQPTVVVLDASSGEQIADIPLPANPGDVRLDPTLGLLFVVIPENETVETIDVRNAKVVQSIAGLPVVTGLAVDQETHTLYVSQLDGQLSVIDEQSGQITSRLKLSDVGLTGVATSGGRVYAVNTPGQELLSVDPSTGEVRHLQLGSEPTAVVVGPQSGAGYVLELTANAVVRLNLSDGTELGRVDLGGTQQEAPSLHPDQLWYRPRMAISASDESLYVTEPQADALALLPPAL